MTIGSDRGPVVFLLYFLSIMPGICICCRSLHCHWTYIAGDDIIPVLSFKVLKSLLQYCGTCPAAGQYVVSFEFIIINMGGCDGEEYSEGKKN